VNTHSDEHAELYLDGKFVGKVKVQRDCGSWGHGYFQPADAFAEFAPLFGRWSLLMHADVGARKLSAAASEELRTTEYELDRLEAQLHFPDTGEWRRCAQLNIDGDLIEWKRY
jgi:hypothetical protein